MATISGVQGNWQVDLIVNETSTNIESNKSSADWSLIIRRTDSGSYPMYGTPTIDINISGKKAYSDSQYFAISSINRDGVLLLSGTVTDIEHNDNGTIQNNTASFSWSGSGFSPNSVSASGTYSTATIPRASSIAVPNYNLGQNISITIGKKVNSFTSTLTYKIGAKTGTIVTKTSDPTYVWEMPEELINQIKQDNPKEKAPDATIYCTTYNGDTQIGEPKEATFKLYIIDKPTIENIEITDMIALLAQYTSSVVKYLSILNVSIEGIAPIGTNISNYKVKCGEIEQNDSTNHLELGNIQYSYLDENGNRKTKFIVTITDERGNSSEEYPIELDFIEYVQLSFNNTDITLTRLNGTSNYMKLKMTGYVYTGMFGENQNTLSIQYRYKLRNDNTAIWSELKEVDVTLNDDNTFEIDNLQLEDEFDYKENYDIEFYASDLFSTIYYPTVIKTSETIVKVHKNGIDVKNLTINGEPISFNENNETLECYSTTEQVIGTWINDKPIYRRVFTGSLTLIGNTWSNVAKVENVDEVINLGGTISNTLTDGRSMNINTWESESYNCTFCYVKETNGANNMIQAKVAGWNNAAWGFVFRLCLEYTKQTD